MVRFYKVSCGDRDIKVISALNKYEAFGYYLLKVQNGSGFADDVMIEEMSPDEIIEVSCIGFPTYETLEQIAKKKEFGDVPQVIIGLV